MTPATTPTPIARAAAPVGPAAATAPGARVVAGDRLGWSRSPAGPARSTAWHDGERAHHHAWPGLKMVADPLEALRMVLEAAPGGERIGWLSYELGGAIEPGAASTKTGPLWLVHRVDPAAAAPSGRAERGPLPTSIMAAGDMAHRDHFMHAVTRAKAYIRAGDVYQANIATPIVLRSEIGALELAELLLARTRPRFGALIEPGPAEGLPIVCSLSPELGVRADFRTGRIQTRPIKGTRPEGSDPAELLGAEKDRAELDMIVDLMRNDLGRVCTLGSVRVAERRRVEPHAGVVHAVATIEGTMRPGTTPIDVIRAVFPFGSITGAPKIRAMQIIDELEGFRRGAYCGSVFRLSDDGVLEMNVAIRTASITPVVGGGCELVYPVGAGIVDDSEPGAEWAETQDKAVGVRAALGMTEHTQVATP
ncbi:MAG: anthranilate synthase component I family protein [Planctomycetota bacterium]